ncbi:MAG: hypothetical protein KatS3mg097_092 [Candidatus Parcubacteria bacterium]|nr:MAG: hypothetical protein KatS3mg097_092 [Candidatus Parcubacteria bacterium]
MNRFFYIFIFLTQFFLISNYIYAGSIYFNNDPHYEFWGVSKSNVFGDPVVFDIFPDIENNYLYIAGDFDLVGLNIGKGSLFSATSGNLLIPTTSLRNLRINDTIYAVVPDNSGGFYIAGNFNLVGTTTVGRVIHILADGTLDNNFKPMVNNTVLALALSSDGSILYIGGMFTQVNSTTKNYVAALNTSDGSLVSSFNADANNTVFALTLSSDGSILYIGGMFTQVNSTTKNYVAALNTSDGSLVSSFNADANSAVRSLVLSSDNSTLYIGGDFTQVNSTTKNYVAALNTSDGSLVSSFNADANSSVYSLVLSSDNSTLYIGGAFTQVNSTTKNYVAALNTSDGSLVSSFNADANNTVFALTLSFDGSILYIGGDFTQVNSITKNYVAALNTSDGSLVSSFNASADNTVRSLVLSSDGSILYIGGYFTQINSTTKNYIAALNTSDGSLVSSFNADANNTVFALALSSDGSILYSGGAFTQINSTTKNYFAALNISDGSLINYFDPSFSGNVLKIVPDNRLLFVGGAFIAVNNLPRPFFAIFPGFSKLNFTSSEQSVIAGNLSNKIDFILKDFYNNNFQPATSVLIYLTSTSVNGSFYSVSNTSTVISQLSIINTATSSFYYKDTKAGAHSLKISALPYASATQNITILPAVTSTNVVINNNNSQTTSTNVTLTLTATYLDSSTSSKQVRISNNGVNYATITFATTVLWDLADSNYGGNSNQGIKNVYAIFLDIYNNESSLATDSIEYIIISSATTTTNEGSRASGYVRQQPFYRQQNTILDVQLFAENLKQILAEIIQSPKICKPYITNESKGQRFRKIKIFLNKFEGTKLKLTPRFDYQLKKELANFQKKYNLKFSSGNLTRETINKINDLYCLRYK